MSVRLDALRATREAAGLTIGRLASVASVSDLVIRTLEDNGHGPLNIGGACSDEVAARIAAALAVSLGDLGVAELRN